MGKKRTKYTDDWCRNTLAAANNYRGAVMTREQWCYTLDCTEYGLDVLREFGETHGAPFVPVEFTGLQLGKKGDEAELIDYRARQAERLVGNGAVKLDQAERLSWFNSHIAPRLEDSAFRNVANAARRMMRRLPAPMDEAAD